jgi:hypothetical protein
VFAAVSIGAMASGAAALEGGASFGRLGQGRSSGDQAEGKRTRVHMDAIIFGGAELKSVGGETIPAVGVTVGWN